MSNMCKKFKTQWCLHFHYRNQHEDPRTCDSCVKTFLSRVKLNMHVTKVHGTKREANYLCQDCGKMFMDGSNLKKHLKVSRAQQNPKCSFFILYYFIELLIYTKSII